MPLPVEKSQGSVSALVARFQTVAAHNAATAQREASRRSSSSSNASTAGTTNGEGVRVTSGTWKKSGGEAAAAPAPTLGKSADGQEGMEVLKDGEEKPGDEVHSGKGEPKASETPVKKPAVASQKPTEPSSTKKADPISLSTPKITKAPASPKSTKIPPNLSIAHSSPSATMTPVVSSPRTRIPSNSSAVASPNPTSNNGPSARPSSGTSQRREASDASSSPSTKSGSTIMRSGIPTSTSSTSSKTSPTTGTSGIRKAAPTSATTKATALGVAASPAAVKKESIPTSQKPAISSTPTAKAKSQLLTSAAKSTSTNPKPRPTSTLMPTPKSTPSAAPPSSFKPTKPLTPSMTGPAPSRRPSSFLGPTPTTTPLRAQVTGTPSKPTASSLAKARSNPIPSDDGNNTTPSLGRPAGKRTSLGPTPTSSMRTGSRAGSESPSQFKAAEGKQQKERVTGSSSMSRLMQGTAASRAKVIEGLPGAAGVVSPAKGNGVAGVPKSASAKSLGNDAKKTGTTITAAAPVISSEKPLEEVSEGKANGEKEAGNIQVSDKPTESSIEVKKEVEVISESEPTEAQNVNTIEKKEKGGEETVSTSNNEDRKETEGGDEDFEPVKETPDLEEAGQTGPVGLSPIGRIGLAAVHDPSTIPQSNDSEIGRHPTVGPLPGQDDTGDLAAADIASPLGNDMAQGSGDKGEAGKEDQGSQNDQ